MIVMIDMDDTIELLVKGWVKYINIKYGTTTKLEDVTDWDITKAFPTLTKEQGYGVEKEDALWDYVEPMPGAKEAMEKILADGHEIYIVTNTVYESLKAKMDKVLFKYFPFIDWGHVIVTRNKHIIKGDVLIDDGIHNMTGGDYKKILFSCRHNLNFDESSIGAVRANNWDEAYALVCQFAKEIE